MVDDNHNTAENNGARAETLYDFVDDIFLGVGHNHRVAETRHLIK